MIRLMELTDKSGKIYSHGKIVFDLDNGVKIYEIADDAKEVIVWIPKELRPDMYEIKKMCNEEFYGSDMEEKIFWPKKLLHDNNSHENCGYTANRPCFDGKVVSLQVLIEEERRIDSVEKIRNVIIGRNLARIFKTVRDTKNRYALGIVSPDSFLVDDAMNVFYIESFNCARNLKGIIRSCYVAPELILDDSLGKKTNSETDVFVYALLLFQVLTGYFPFSNSDNIDKMDIEHIWNLICDGISIFYDESDEYSKIIQQKLQRYPEEITTLFKRTFNYCGNKYYAEGRPTIDEWLEVLSDSATRIENKLGGSNEHSTGI